ncbi:hypothetical protein C6497_13240 [Candidatus Poribacteria bacterium]|nr:MAG: hypothetical protein C6497_13240 [Candidatus Poribacteria bacterium]
MKYLFSILILFSFIFIVNGQVSAYSFDPPNEKTGAPGESNCTDCHSGNTLNAFGGSLVLTVPNTYLPGMVYDIVVKLERDGQKRWGFEMTALNDTNTRAGTFSTTDANTQVKNENNKQYIKQTSVGTAQGTEDMHSWMFKWTAPTSNIGPITFYAAGNAANGDSGTSGDYIYTQKATSEVITHGVAISSDKIKKETTDANTGVEYTLKVTNTGNVEDTFKLSSSAEISIGGVVHGSFKQVNSQDIPTAQLEITIDPGESKNVIFIVSGDLLTRPGTFPIEVTATSNGDTSKSDKINTITTIKAVYGVSIEGIGTLTQEIADVSTGVNYTVRITNTGNDRDTIILTTSGDITAKLSNTSITLNSGAFRDVSISIPNEALSKAGEYEVKITALSQSDISKTDEIITRTVVLPVYNVTLEGIGDLTSEISDASGGVTYKFTVSNTGNTDDVIDLSTSGDVSATLSQTTVSLSYGSSTEVTLSIPGSELTRAGEYSVKVTASSQGNSDKTAEVSTTTKILPVYNVTIEGIGDVTSETSDASDDISYKFTVSNTGNTDDVIDLSISGDVTATLSQDSVSLDSGASTEVTLTIDETSLANAGDYTVKVTATSQGDTDKTAEVSTTTKILPVYNVTIEGIGDATSETSDASDGITYRFTVSNTGNTDDVIDLSTSGDVSGELSQTSVALASGSSIVVILTIDGASLANAGDYTVKVTATSQGDTDKTAEVSTTTKILPVYNISIEGIGDVTSETSDASDGVTYRFTVSNTGNTDDVIDLSTSGDVSGELSQTSVALASGASIVVILTIDGSSLVSAGDYTVKITATSQGDIKKISELTTTTTILPVYGISLFSDDNLVTETTDAGDGVIYKITVTNTGNTEDTIKLSSSGDVTSTLSHTSVTLASGSSTEVILTVPGNFLTIAGNYKVSITATSGGDNSITDEITTTTTILSVYGVVVEGVGDLITKTTNARNGVSYIFKITNTGNTEDTFVLTPSDNTASIDQTSITLASNASVEVMLSIPASTLAFAGDYNVTVTVTSQGDNTQSTEISTTTTILPNYDITITGLMKLSTDASGADAGIQYKFIVTNNGNTDDVVNLSISDEAIATLNLNSISLESGTSQEVILTISPEAISTAGELEVIVTATSKGNPEITAETTISTSIDPVYGIMFEGTDQREGSTVDVLEGVSYELTLTNIGNIKDTILLGSSAEIGIEGSLLGSFMASTNQDISTSQVEVTLNPGESVTVTFTTAGDFFTKPGNYEIFVTATSLGDDTKTDEIKIITTIDPVVWDLNADGIVNILDLVTIANQFGETGEGLIGDVNMDGTVNILDLVEVASYFGKSQVEIIEAL